MPRLASLRYHVTAALATALVLGAVLMASLGAAGAQGRSHHSRHHHRSHHHSCIPQTSRHTDHDADNRGGPNDGDGCV